MNEPTTSNRPRNPAIIIPSLASIAILVIVAGFLWLRHAESKDKLQALSVQNSRLQQELSAAKKEISNLQGGDSSKKTKERLASKRESRPPQPVEDEAETLVLQTPTVRQTAEGLVVHFEFKPSGGIELPENIILAVRVPTSSPSRLMRLAPVSETDSSSIRSVINPAGYIGFIQGSSADLGTLAFEFTVSAPVKATVSGSEGIIDYEFDISPDGCTARKL